MKVHTSSTLNETVNNNDEETELIIAKQFWDKF